MTESESMVYRVVPKCACSSIGQIMFYSDHGRYFDGDIHDSTGGLHKWNQPDSQPLIESNVTAHKALTFTCVRNPMRASCPRSSTRSPASSATASATAAISCRS